MHPSAVTPVRIETLADCRTRTTKNGLHVLTSPLINSPDDVRFCDMTCRLSFLTLICCNTILTLGSMTGCDICIESAFTVQCHKCSFLEDCQLNCTACQDSAGRVGYPDLFSIPPGGCLLQSNEDYQLECRPGSEGTCSEPTSLVHATGNASFCRHTNLPPSCMLFAFFPIQISPHSQGAAELIHIMVHLPNAKCVHSQRSYQLVTAHTSHAICRCCFVTSTVFTNFGLITA